MNIIKSLARCGQSWSNACPLYTYSVNNNKISAASTFQHPKILKQQIANQGRRPDVDLALVSNMLKMMINKIEQSFPREEQLVEEHMRQLRTEQLFLLLSYLHLKYGHMTPERLFIATTKRIRTIQEITPNQFRKILAQLLILKWEQDPLVRLYNIMQKKIQSTSTQDLAYLVLYGQYVKKINLYVFHQYIASLLSRRDHRRTSHFLLYQALYSTQGKNSLCRLVEYKQALRNLDNALKGANYEKVYGKEQFLMEIEKAQQSRQQLQGTLSQYMQLSLKQAVVLGGISNEKLLQNVQDVIQKNLLAITPKCLSDLLKIVPKQKYFVQYLNVEHPSMSIQQILQLFQNVLHTGISKNVIKLQFTALLNRRHYISPEVLNQLKSFAQTIGVQVIQSIGWTTIHINPETHKEHKRQSE